MAPYGVSRGQKGEENVLVYNFMSYSSRWHSQLDGKFDMKVKSNVFTYIYAMYDAHIATLGYMFYCYDRETCNLITP